LGERRGRALQLTGQQASLPKGRGGPVGERRAEGEGRGGRNACAAHPVLVSSLPRACPQLRYSLAYGLQGGGCPPLTTLSICRTAVEHGAARYSQFHEAIAAEWALLLHLRPRPLRREYSYRPDDDDDDDNGGMALLSASHCAATRLPEAASETFNGIQTRDAAGRKAAAGSQSLVACWMLDATSGWDICTYRYCVQ